MELGGRCRRLSRRTVQSHVSSILAKLELASRVEVAVSAHSRKPI